MQFKVFNGYKIYPTGAIMHPNGFFCRLSVNSKGYENVSINGKLHKVHRLVAEAFIPNPQGLPQVNHKDGNKLNNEVSNLEWATASQNTKHAYEMGLMNKQGTNNGRAILNDDIVRHIRTSGMSAKQVAEEYGLEYTSAWKVVTGRTWKHV